MMCTNDHTRVCPVCGTIHYPPDLTTYVYKRVFNDGKQVLTLYFCKWSCLRKWEKDHEKKPIIETPLKTGDEHCSDCRYCVKGKYGFIDCTVNQAATNLRKVACRRFKPRWDDQEEVL